MFEFCSCEIDVETLCRSNYWPATPKIPEFMNLIEVLLLVAAKDFLAAIKHKTVWNIHFM